MVSDGLKCINCKSFIFLKNLATIGLPSHPVFEELNTSCTDRNQKASAAQLAKRPSWAKVYAGYPKIAQAGIPTDVDAHTVFSSVLGANYDSNVLNNACATRVSLGLINGGTTIPPGFKIRVSTHPHFQKGFQTSAVGLKNFLSRTTVWGTADVVICNADSLTKIANIIGSRNGVYFIIGGFAPPTSGHATLWLGSYKNVIGRNHYANQGRTVYFWELK
ncbi:T6SS effector amidase Tae4 family protein [Neisseria sp.]|uniref:T6SS effector amidase Tae4 family protein n=1 Tax=Neisseria sp. TaxID=192066 RepID=UPI0026DAE69F|nr:T6SS effector amidase Tae4 family protein [Neisseria sp.]MDO4907847.1 T6SS effector amidase Tae4 family protein [Neisseria sp.]